MTIQEMQDEILKVGWQFEEHVFNDGNPNNCHIECSPSKNPHIFSMPRDYDNPIWEERKKNVGWGRFPRHTAWVMAYDYIVRGLRS